MKKKNKADDVDDISTRIHEWKKSTDDKIYTFKNNQNVIDLQKWKASKGNEFNKWKLHAATIKYNLKVKLQKQESLSISDIKNKL